MAEKQFFTPQETADRWGCSYDTVLTHIYDGSLKAVNIGTNPSKRQPVHHLNRGGGTVRAGPHSSASRPPAAEAETDQVASGRSDRVLQGGLIMTRLTWSRRAVVRRTPVATLRRYRAQEQPLAVIRIDSTLGLPGRWLAVRQLVCGGEIVISRHRTRIAAERGCAEGGEMTLPATISSTRHFRQRMQERHINWREVHDAVEHGRYLVNYTGIRTPRGS